jgi:hypothetical protein
MIAADRLAKETRLASCYEDAARYKVLALRGIRRDLAVFSKENSLGVLAASISMMHAQETPEDWHKMSTGTMAVMDTMRPWLDATPFWPVLQHMFPDERPSAMDACVGHHRDGAIRMENPDASVIFVSTTDAVSFLLEHGITAVTQLATCLKQSRNLSATARELADTLSIAQARQTSNKKQDPYWLAHPFCEITHRASIPLCDVEFSQPLVLALLAHMYAAMIVLAMLHPELDTAGWIAIRITSLDALAQHFESVSEVHCEACRRDHATQDLLAFPWNAVRAYRKWQADRHRQDLEVAA